MTKHEKDGKLKYNVNIPGELLELIQLCREVEYGEITWAEMKFGHLVPAELTLKEKHFARLFMNGLQAFKKIIIHGGEPTIVEIDVKTPLFAGTKKIKL